MGCGRGTGEDKTRSSATCTEGRGCKGSFESPASVASCDSPMTPLAVPCSWYIAHDPWTYAKSFEKSGKHPCGAGLHRESHVGFLKRIPIR